MTHNIVDETGVRVMKDRCPTCIFRPGNAMHLNRGVVRDMVDEANADDAGSIVCHDTLDDEKQAVCRGFFDRHATPLLQIAERMGFIVEWEREHGDG